MDCFYLNEEGYLIKSFDQNLCQYKLIQGDQNFDNFFNASFYTENFSIGFFAVFSVWTLTFLTKKIIQTFKLL